jgi:poly(beta-D-mannuronate) lyase
MKARTLLAAWVAVDLFGCAAFADEYRVSSARDIAQVEGQAHPGDVVVMLRGTWSDQAVVFKKSGTAEQPIVLRAEVPGQVILEGRSSIEIEANYVVVSGLLIKYGERRTDGVALKGSQCRLTETAIIDSGYRFFVHLFGSEERVDHCYLAGKTSESPTLQIEAREEPNRDSVDHNHFGPQPVRVQGGGAAIQIGDGGASMNVSSTLVEKNLFERCDGDPDIISSQSCGNICRGNTFNECAGMLTLRDGNGCVVEGNIFLGHNKAGTGGVRVVGEDHIIIDNYIDGVAQGAVWVTCGEPESPPDGYFQARNCLIAFNSMIACPGPCLQLSAGLGSAERSLLPESITIANNLFAVSAGKSLWQGTEGADFQWVGNFASGAAESPAHEGIRRGDVKLVQGNDGLWRPSADSPVRGAAQGDLPLVKKEMAGRLRSGRLDVGCDQASETAGANRPLAPAEVGPSWLDRRGQTQTQAVSQGAKPKGGG